MIPNFTAQEIKTSLHKALEALGEIDNCALLDYPDHPNIGDSLIWLGEIFYLVDILKTNISYLSSRKNFSNQQMEQKIGNSPILLHGGGNLGDIWPYYQNFRLKIISEYKENPIFILPQTIYFADSNNVKQTAEVFNAHPNLTIFVRDHHSYDFAKKHFGQCKNILAPDMAFQMLKMPGLTSKYESKNSILIHRRLDKEKKFLSKELGNFSNTKIEDWASYRDYLLKDSWSLRDRARAVRDGWIPESISRYRWQNFHPYSKKLNALCSSDLQKKAWHRMHQGVYQFSQHKAIITDRLHGHILSVLMGIPHIFLPNSYYKNESFYQAWTHSVPFCRFVKDTSEIPTAFAELMQFFNLKQ